MATDKKNLKIIIIIAIYALVSSIIATSVIIVIELLGLKLLILYIISYAIIISTDIFILYYSISSILAGYNNIIKNMNSYKRDDVELPNIQGKTVQLTDSEKVLEAILEKNNGKILQNSLIGKTGFSAPTISRILASMESKGVIERRRYGMTNEIVLKKR